MVSGRMDHMLATDDLMVGPGRLEYPADDKGRYAGQTRKNVLAMAREVVAEVAGGEKWAALAVKKQRVLSWRPAGDE